MQSGVNNGTFTLHKEPIKLRKKAKIAILLSIILK
jgi:hypothetical protein